MVCRGAYREEESPEQRNRKHGLAAKIRKQTLYKTGLASVVVMLSMIAFSCATNGYKAPLNLHVANTALANGTVDANYSATLTATNGQPPYTWSIQSGQLPSGVLLQSSTGVIAGQPTRAGTFQFVAEVSDASGDSGSTSLGITVNSPPSPTIAAVSPTSGAVGTVVTITGTNFNPGATVTFGSTSGTATTVSSATQLRSTVPNAPAGTYTVTVTDPPSGTAALSNAFTITTAANPSSGSGGTQNPETNHFLYVLTAGPSITVYDIDQGFKETKKVSAGSSDVGVRGAVASAAGNALYISYGCDSPEACTPYLMKYDLLKDSVVWNNILHAGIDSHSITPDGKTIYMPTGEGDIAHSLLYLIDTSTGNTTGTIDGGVFGPHNTIVSNDGAHVYLGGAGLDTNGNGKNYLVKTDTTDGAVSMRIGPVKNNSTRPFTIDAQEKYAFIITRGLNGFQVGDISTGSILYTASVSGFSDANCNPTVICSHGISLSPNNKEIYVVDYYNNYVHVFDVSGLPDSAPKQVADIALKHAYTYNGTWVTHSRDGKLVFVGQSGDVIDTSTRQIVGYIPALSKTKVYTEIDFQNGAVSFAPLSRSGVGYDK